MENEAFLQEQQDRLNELVRPYQREINRRQRLADFVSQCMRSAARDDFFQLYDLLNSRQATDVEAEPGYETAHNIFETLRQDALRKVERYQYHFMEDFAKLVAEAGLPLDNDFPRLRLLQGMELEVKFTTKQTVLNGKTLKTVDPQRIMRAVLSLKRRLYDRPFEPQQFIDGVFAAVQKVNRSDGRRDTDSAPIQPVYLEYTLSLQSRSFLQDMAKGRFREYDADQFAVDFWRYFKSDVAATSGGYVLRLDAGRGNTMWLIDSSGVKRRFSALTFLQE